LKHYLNKLKQALSNGETIKVYFVSLGATTNDVIQVRKSNSNNPIRVFENHKYVSSVKLINDTALQLIMTPIENQI
jgi:hypothetical protein